MTHPFVKWAGGKRQLLPSILCRLPEKIDTFYEPFVGGGAVFFSLADKGLFQSAVVNDLNHDLMTAFRTFAAGHVEEVIHLLQSYPYEEGFYYDMRARAPKDMSDVEKTSRFIYLNRTGFNGLYRVNKLGEFNVPFGDYTNPTICDAVNLRSVARILSGNVRILEQDFEECVNSAKSGDFVYFDPPYLPISETSNFTSYTKDGFGYAEHVKLANTFTRLAKSGVAVLLSNSNHPAIRKLYDGFRIARVRAKRNINSKGASRGAIHELLISANLPEPRRAGKPAPRGASPQDSAKPGVPENRTD